MPEFLVSKVSELKTDVPTEVEVGTSTILLVRHAGAVSAVASTCPHRGVPLRMGVVQGGEIICGVHRAAFDLASGECVRAPACNNLARYETRIDGDDIYVTIDKNREAHPLPNFTRRNKQNKKRFVIVGNGAAGWRATETLRRLGYSGELTVITDDTPQPYDRTELSKGFLALDSESSAHSMRDEDFTANLDIEVICDEAIELAPNEKSLRLKSGDEVVYDKLLVATGCGSRKLESAEDFIGVHTLRDLEDAKHLRSQLKAASAQAPFNVVIVGAGFIGLEAAASLSKQENVTVHVVMKDDLPLKGLLGEKLAARLIKEHEEAGVIFHPSTEADEFNGDNRIQSVKLSNDTEIECAVVLVAIGAEPRTGWLPFSKNDDGGISVEENLALKNHPDVFLAGDIAQVPTTWGNVRIEHWRFAQETGEIAAKNMMEFDGHANHRYDSTPFFWSMQQIDGSYTYTGHAIDFDAMEGNPDDEDFVLNVQKDGKIVAVIGHGTDADLVAAERKMAGKNQS